MLSRGGAQSFGRTPRNARKCRQANVNFLHSLYSHRSWQRFPFKFFYNFLSRRALPSFLMPPTSVRPNVAQNSCHMAFSFSHTRHSLTPRRLNNQTMGCGASHPIFAEPMMAGMMKVRARPLFPFARVCACRATNYPTFSVFFFHSQNLFCVLLHISAPRAKCEA